VVAMTISENSYRVEHPLFRSVLFTKEEAVVEAAERLCRFLIRDLDYGGDRSEVSVEISRYATEEDEGDTRTIWWHFKTVTAVLEVGISE